MNETVVLQRQSELRQTGRSRFSGSAMARLWRSWTVILESVARSRRRSVRISAEEYERLHQRLMDVLDHQCENDELSEGERNVYSRMREHCRPWVSLDPLKHAERRIVREVASAARDLHCEAFGKSSPQRRAVFLLLASAALIAGGALLAWLASMGQNGDLASVGDLVHDGVLRGWYRGVDQFQRLEYGAWIVAGVSLMLATGIWTLRSARTF